MPPTIDALHKQRAHTVARDWLIESGILHDKSEAIPGPSRFTPQLAVVVAAFVDPMGADFEAEATGLLWSAHDALAADLEQAGADVSAYVRGRAEYYGVTRTQLIKTHSLQDRVAATLRDRMLAAWGAAFVDGVRVGPIPRAWVGPDPDLVANLHLLTKLHRCRRWANEVGAVSMDDFPTRWGTHIELRIAAVRPEDHALLPGMVGLGDLDVPDLVNTAQEPEDWRAATDRSFLHRIRLYWDSKHIPESLDGHPGAQPPDDRFAEIAEPGRALVEESIERTLAPLGLFDIWHRGLVESLAGEVTKGAQLRAAGGQVSRLSREIRSLWPDRDAGRPAAATLAGVTAAATQFTAAFLRAAELGQPIEEHNYGKAVARRIWVRMHAWELVGATIPAAEFIKALRTALDLCRFDFGVNRPFQAATPAEVRLHNTLDLVHRISSELQSAGEQLTVDAIARSYRERWGQEWQAPATLARGGIHRPKYVERLLGRTGAK